MRYYFGLIVLFSFGLSAQNYADITASLGISNVKMAFSYGSGVSAEDFDEDGDLDIVICSDIDSPASLLINQGNNSFEEIFFDFDFHSRVALWIDYNGDHRLDLLFMGDCLRLGNECKQTLELFKQKKSLRSYCFPD